MRNLPINCAARNAVWLYPRVCLPRFAGAPTIVETRRSYQLPDLAAMPEGAEVEVQLYGGHVTLKLDGWLHRISVERFRWVRFADEEAARAAFLELWESIENLQSVAEVIGAATAWYNRYERLQPPSPSSVLNGRYGF